MYSSGYLKIIGGTIHNPENVVVVSVNTPHPDTSPVSLKDTPVLLTSAHRHISGKDISKDITGVGYIWLPLITPPCYGLGTVVIILARNVSVRVLIKCLVTARRSGVPHQRRTGRDWFSGCRGRVW